MYEYDSRVRLTETDQNRRMTLNAILNAFQDCSTFHSEDLGVGMELLGRRNRMWVLRSWKIVIFRYPEMAEHIRVGTWPYEFGKMTGKRNFRLMDARGQLAACADTLWVFMDTVRMRPVRVDEDIQAAYSLEPKLDMEYDTDRIRIPELLKAEEAFPVHVSHLDVNHHVNNGQYVQMAGEYLPENFVIHQMRAEYKRQAVLGDLICPQTGENGNGYTTVLGNRDGTPYAIVEFKTTETV